MFCNLVRATVYDRYLYVIISSSSVRLKPLQEKDTLHLHKGIKIISKNRIGSNIPVLAYHRFSYLVRKWEQTIRHH